MTDTNEFCIITTTTDNAETAAHIAHILLEQRLAACVQTCSIQSHYRWDGELTRDQEIRIDIKTRTDHFDEIRKRILSLHNYDLPEIIMTPVTGGSADYLGWIREETSSAR